MPLELRERRKVFVIAVFYFFQESRWPGWGPGFSGWRGESRFRVDGVDGATRSSEGTGVAVMRVVWVLRAGARPGEGKPGNGKGRWAGAGVCLNRDLRNLSLEFPVKD